MNVTASTAEVSALISELCAADDSRVEVGPDAEQLIRTHHLAPLLVAVSVAEPADDPESEDGFEMVMECEMAVPFAPMWVRNTAAGELELVCGHSPEHVQPWGR